MSMEDLSSVLWQERDLLETLLYKLEVEQMVLAGGRTRWLPAAARDIDACLAQIREVELLRAVAVDAVAAELGLEPNPSLHEIADRCEQPWRDIWLDHREAFTTVAAQIGRMSESNRTLLTAGYQAAQATLLSMSEGSGTYASDGSLDAGRGPRLVDRSL